MLGYALKGAGEPAPVIVYLHGLGMAGWCWDPIRAALPQFGALVPDLPGHGASTAIKWRSLEQAAGLVADVVDTLPADRQVFVTGHSLGAYVGALLLVQRPQRFAGAVLSGFHVGAIARRTLLKLAYVVNGLMFRSPFLMRRFASALGDAPFAERFVDGATVIKPQTIRRAGAQVVDFVLPEAFEALTVPVLALAGDREPEAIRAMPALLSEGSKNVAGRVLEGRGHLWPVQEPQTYADVLAAYFLKLERR